MYNWNALGGRFRVHTWYVPRLERGFAVGMYRARKGIPPEVRTAAPGENLQQHFQDFFREGVFQEDGLVFGQQIEGGNGADVVQEVFADGK